MAEADPKTTEKRTETPEGGSVGGTVARVLFLIGAGTGLFYLLGQMTTKVRGIEQQADQAAEEQRAGAGAAARGAQSAIPDLPRLAPYPNALSHAGGEVFLLNGIPRRIATFGTKDRPDRVADWYVKAWEAVGLQPFGNGNGESASSSAMDLGSNLRYSVTAQWIPESQMTVGHLSVSTVAPVDNGFQQTHLPLPEGSEPLMDVQSSDAGAPGAMVAYMIPLSTGGVRAHLLEKMPEAGWKYEENYSQPQDERGFCVMFFSHGDRLLTLTLDPVGDGRTSMVVNESEDLK